MLTVYLGQREEMVFLAYQVLQEMLVHQAVVGEDLKDLKDILVFLVILDQMDYLDLMVSQEDRALKVKR